jgi:hypothetical protein
MYKSTKSAVLALVGSLLVVGGCSQKHKIKEKAKWICTFEQYKELNREEMPSSASLSDYIVSEDLDYHESQEEKDESNGLGKLMGAAMANVKKGTMESKQEHVTCKIDKLKLKGDRARVHFTRTEPDLSTNGSFDRLGKIMKAESADEAKSLMDKWYRKAQKTKTDKGKLFFRKTDNGWRAYLGLEKRALEKKLKQKKEKLQNFKSVLKDLKTLSGVKVTSAGLRTKHINRFRKERVIDLTIANNLDQAISGVKLYGTYKSQNRSVPWEKGTVSFNISGGVEPGETMEMVLTPNPISDWAQTDIRKEAKLKFKALKVKGPQGEAIAQVSKGMVADFENPVQATRSALKNQAEKVKKLESKIASLTPEPIESSK